jgi:hypothetical protein
VKIPRKVGKVLRHKRGLDIRVTVSTNTHRHVGTRVEALPQIIVTRIIRAKPATT